VNVAISTVRIRPMAGCKAVARSVPHFHGGGPTHATKTIIGERINTANKLVSITTLATMAWNAVRHTGSKGTSAELAMSPASPPRSRRFRHPHLPRTNLREDLRRPQLHQRHPLQGHQRYTRRCLRVENRLYILRCTQVGSRRSTQHHSPRFTRHCTLREHRQRLQRAPPHTILRPPHSLGVPASAKLVGPPRRLSSTSTTPPMLSRGRTLWRRLFSVSMKSLAFRLTLGSAVIPHARLGIAMLC